MIKLFHARCFFFTGEAADEYDEFTDDEDVEEGSGMESGDD